MTVTMTAATHRALIMFLLLPKNCDNFSVQLHSVDFVLQSCCGLVVIMRCCKIVLFCTRHCGDTGPKNRYLTLLCGMVRTVGVRLCLFRHSLCFVWTYRLIKYKQWIFLPVGTPVITCQLTTTHVTLYAVMSERAPFNI